MVALPPEPVSLLGIRLFQFQVLAVLLEALLVAGVRISQRLPVALSAPDISARGVGPPFERVVAAKQAVTGPPGLATYYARAHPGHEVGLRRSRS